MSEVAYTTGRFPVVDITHHSKRTQSGNLNSHPDRVYKSEEDDAPKSSNIEVSVPRAVTVENAIDFYSNAQVTDIQLAKLYSATSVWLEDYLKLKNVKEATALREKTADEVSEQIDKELNEMKEEA